VRGRPWHHPADVREGRSTSSVRVNWERVYAECLPAMLEAAAARVAGRPDLDAADVAHEVFAAVLADPPRDVGDWREFLTGRTASVCLGDRAPDLEDVRPDEDVVAIVMRRVSAAEARRRLLRVLDYMTEGLSVGEIAERVDTSSSNISQIVVRCLTKLGPSLVQLDGFDRHDLERVRPPRRLPVVAAGGGHRPEAGTVPTVRVPAPRPDPGRLPAGWAQRRAPVAHRSAFP
jgi:DNA-directed RNA polymerase specialized sigma24 family protein